MEHFSYFVNPALLSCDWLF